MRSLRNRLVFAFLLGLSLSFLAGAAVLIGRQLRSPVVAALLFEIRPDFVAYDLIDIDHGLTDRSLLEIAGSSYSRIRFDTDPPLVLQGRQHEETFVWTLNRLDVLRGELTPVLRLEAPSSPPLDLNTAQQSGDQVSIFAPQDRGIYRASAANPDAALLAVAPQDVESVVWSPDWSHLVISAIRGVTLVRADGAEPTALTVPGDLRQSPIWSPDGRYLLFSPQTGLVDALISVVDADTGEIVLRTTGRTPRWCAGRILYTRRADGDLIEVRLTGLESASDEVLMTRDLSAAPASERTLTALPLDRASCDWIIAGTFGAESWLLHRQSRALFPLEQGVGGLIDVSPESIVYWSEVGRNTLVRRTALDLSAPRSDLLLTLTGRGFSFARLADRRGWVILNAASELFYWDEDTPSAVALSEAMVRDFLIVP